jgi:hypothetical protein
MPRLAFGSDDRDRYTLRRVVELNLLLVFECRNCRRVSQADILDLIERFGTNATLGEIRTKGRCRICKKQSADILMREPGSRKDMGWWPRPPRAKRE